MQDTRIWWKEDEDNVAPVLTAVIAELNDYQDYRYRNNLRNMRLYSNLAILGLSAEEYAGEESLPTNRLTLNVVESVVETAKALIGTNKPKVKFLTSGGSYESRMKAEQLTEFCSGIFHTTDTYSKAQRVFGDAAVFGTGFMKIYDEDGEVMMERIFPDEVIIDDVEGKYGTPRSLYVHKDVERSVLKAEYPELAGFIEESGRMRERTAFMTTLSDPVSVLEAWHLPSSKKSNDGRHVISLTNIPLEDEGWTEDEFPLVEFCWCERPLGFWGKGVPEQLRGLQIEINMILQKVQRLMNLASSKVFVGKGSKVNKAQLNNKEWGLVEYAGSKPPIFATVEAVSPEYYIQLERLYAKAFEIAGVSQAFAQSEKPKGLESGTAIREYNDIQSRRFLHRGQAWEHFFVRLADKQVRCAKRIASEGNGSYKILTEHEDELIEVDWKDINPGKDKYRIRAWPANLLPDTPAGQLATIETLIQMDPRVRASAFRMLKHPDVEALTRRMYAPEMVVEKMIGEILKKGKEGFIPPSPYMDLNSAITQMQYALNEAIYSEVEEEKLQLFRDWIDAAAAILNPPPTPEELEMQRIQMEAAAMQGGQGGGQQAPAPPMMPGSTPTTPVGA